MKPQMTYVAIFLFTLASCVKILEFDGPGNLVPKTVVEDPLLPGIEVNGTLLHAESFGNNRNSIIIFLHGGPGGDYRAFISQIGKGNASRYPGKRTIEGGGLSCLQDSFYCVFYDQRGAGLSPRFDRGEVNFALYLEDLDAIISYYIKKKEDETGLVDSQVFLVGWSYGGTVAAGYINKNPARIKDVALYEPGPFTKRAYDYFIAHTTSYFAQIGTVWLDEYLLSLDHFTADDHERADYQTLLGAFRSNPQFHENPNVPLWRSGALIAEEDLEDQNRDNTSNLGAFSGSLLFIAGELTRKEYPDYSSIQTACFPRSEYVEISGVGHSGPWEKPDEVASAIRTFFKSN